DIAMVVVVGMARGGQKLDGFRHYPAAAGLYAILVPASRPCRRARARLWEERERPLRRRGQDGCCARAAQRLVPRRQPQGRRRPAPSGEWGGRRIKAIERTTAARRARWL